MKVAEILKLTSAGYKVADIKELMELEKQVPEAVQIAAAGASLTDVKDLISLVASEDGESPEEVVTGPDKSEPEPDYKKLYEELKEKTGTLEDTLKAIQEDNQRKDVSGNTPNLDETLADIVTSFM